MSTLGELLEKERRRYFTDRESEILLFKSLLELSEPRYRVLAIYGIGGIGKTALLEEFRQICKERNTLVAKIDGAEQRSVIEVLKSIHAQLDPFVGKVGPFRGFDNDYKRYLELQAKLQKEGEGTFERMTKVLSKLGGAFDPTGIIHRVGEENIESALNTLYRFLTKPEVDFYLGIDKVLTDKLLEGLRKLKPRLVIMFDTYEQILELDDWVREKFVARLPEQAIVVVSGRRELRGKWEEWQPLIKSIKLLSFSSETTREYLERRGIKEAELIEEIFDLSEGHPLCIAMSADLTEKEPHIPATGLAKEPKRFVVIESLIKRLTERITDPHMEEMLEICSIVRYFNEDTLRFFLKEKFDKKLFAQLQDYSFVRWREDGLAIHDLVRDFWDRNLRMRSPDRFDELHRKALTFYEQKLTKVDERQWQKLTQEQLYHSVLADEDRGIRLFLGVFVERLGYYDKDFCEVLLNEAREYPVRQERNHQYVEYCRGRLLLARDNWKEAEEIYRALLSQSEIDITLKLLIMGDLGWSLVKLNRLDEAVRICQESIRLSAQLGADNIKGQFLRSLGAAYLRQGKLNKAVKSTRESAELYERLGYEHELARSLNGLGVAYRGAGRWDESVQANEQSTSLYRKLEDEYGLGKSLHNLGHSLCLTDKPNDALRCFQESIEIFERLENDYWISNCLHGVGGAYLAIGDFERAIPVLQQGLKIKRGLEDSFGCSLILRRLGNAHSAEGRIEEARECYTQSLDISVRHGNQYMEMTCLTHLSRLSYIMQEYTKAERLTQRAQQIGTEHGYLAWLAHLEAIKGDVYLHKGLHGQFFDSYARACKNALLFNKYVFAKILTRVARHIDDFATNSGIELATDLVNFLIDFWENEGWEEAGPDFIPLLRRTQEFLSNPEGRSVFECGWPQVEPEIQT